MCVSFALCRLVLLCVPSWQVHEHMAAGPWHGGPESAGRRSRSRPGPFPAALTGLLGAAGPAPAPVPQSPDDSAVPACPAWVLPATRALGGRQELRPPRWQQRSPHPQPAHSSGRRGAASAAFPETAWAKSNTEHSQHFTSFIIAKFLCECIYWKPGKIKKVWEIHLQALWTRLFEAKCP